MSDYGTAGAGFTDISDEDKPTSSVEIPEIITSKTLTSLLKPNNENTNLLLEDIDHFDRNKKGLKIHDPRIRVVIVCILLALIIIIVSLVVIDNNKKSENSSSASDGGNYLPCTTNISSCDLLLFVHPSSMIYTMDETSDTSDTRVDSFCVDVSNSKYLFVGNEQMVESECKNHSIANMKSLKILSDELEGYIIIPGLIDSHAHIMNYGSNLFCADLSDAKSITDILQILTEFIADNNISDTEWVQGWGWDQQQWQNWTQDTFPNRAILDAVFPDHLLFLRRIDEHSAWVNTAALNADGVPNLQNMSNPDGGQIIRFSNGTITGILVDTAMLFVSDVIPEYTEEELLEQLQLVMNECSEYGLTGVQDAGISPDIMQLYWDALTNNSISFSIRINAFVLSSSSPMDYEQFFNARFYEDILTVNTVKFFMDGALGSWGAAMIDPYCDRINETGLLRWKNESEFYENISEWHNAGYQIAVHAIGDAANREVINAYEKLIAEYNLSDHRLRIEHAQIVQMDDIQRIGELHIIPSMQPTHCTSDMTFAGDRLNCSQYPNRLLGAYAWQTLLNASVPALPFGSDFPAVGVLNPFLGIYAAITREDVNGYPDDGWEAYNKVSRYQAVKGYTYAAAYAMFMDDELGSITVGKYADFIIIDTNIFESVNASDIIDTNVIATFLGGKVVYKTHNFN